MQFILHWHILVYITASMLPAIETTSLLFWSNTQHPILQERRYQKPVANFTLSMATMTVLIAPPTSAYVHHTYLWKLRTCKLFPSLECWSTRHPHLRRDIPSWPGLLVSRGACTNTHHCSILLPYETVKFIMISPKSLSQRFYATPTLRQCLVACLIILRCPAVLPSVLSVLS